MRCRALKMRWKSHRAHVWLVAVTANRPNLMVACAIEQTLANLRYTLFISGTIAASNCGIQSRHRKPRTAPQEHQMYIGIGTIVLILVLFLIF